jgi:ATP-dependent Lhr-like helicase
MERLALGRYDVEGSLTRIEAQGQVLARNVSGRIARREAEVEWCDRRLLQRIHRLTVGRLRRDIEPLSAAGLHAVPLSLAAGRTARDGARAAGLTRPGGSLQGLELPAAAWERDVFPARMKQYVGEWLDQACFGGEVAWGRLTLREPKLTVQAAPGRSLRHRRERAGRGDETAGPHARRLAHLRAAAAELDWLLEAARPEDAAG